VHARVAEKRPQLGEIRVIDRVQPDPPPGQRPAVRLCYLPRHGSTGYFHVREATPRGSDEGAETGDGAADDERVDLAGALVGVDRLRVGDEPADLVFQQDAVPAEQLTRVADRLPH